MRVSSKLCVHDTLPPQPPHHRLGQTTLQPKPPRHPQIRYLVQLTAAGITLFSFGPFPQPWLNPLGLPGELIASSLTLIAITALINFYNFMDGLDCLVARVTLVQLGFLALYLNQPLWWLLVAALLGFLWWNWSPAKIFMGDVGSTVLGAAVAISLLNADNPIPPWTALTITLPLTAHAIYTPAASSAGKTSSKLTASIASKSAIPQATLNLFLYNHSNRHPKLALLQLP